LRNVPSTVPAHPAVGGGVGHAPHLEVATRFNRDLAEFVRSMP
jgi:hypothetical protein